jgi:hypothetical protein
MLFSVIRVSSFKKLSELKRRASGGREPEQKGEGSDVAPRPSAIVLSRYSKLASHLDLD